LKLLLIARPQILGPRRPDELTVAVVSGGRVFVINARTRTNVKPILACDAIWIMAVLPACRRCNEAIENCRFHLGPGSCKLLTTAGNVRSRQPE
jgi:hypothetical protein